MIELGKGQAVLMCATAGGGIEFRQEYHIERDGLVLECPYSGRPCGPRCPHHQLRKSAVNGGFMLTLTCGRGPSMTVENGVDH